MTRRVIAGVQLVRSDRIHAVDPQIPDESGYYERKML